MNGLPAGWGARLLDNADIEASAGELEGVETFQACSWLARMRTYQGRLDEITALLLRARGLIEIAPPTEENTIDAVAHSLRERDLKLFLGEVPSVRPKPEWAVVDNRRWQGVWDMTLAVAGAELAALGEYEEARAVFDEWLYLNPEASEAHTGRHFGSAICSLELGDEAAAVASLENAGLSLQTTTAAWTHAKWSAKISAAYRKAGLDDESTDWEGRLMAILCPETTKAALLERALRIAAQPCYAFG